MYFVLLETGQTVAKVQRLKRVINEKRLEYATMSITFHHDYARLRATRSVDR